MSQTTSQTNNEATASIGSVALQCCICGGPLTQEAGHLRCAAPDCPGDFPVVNGIPVLINEARSVVSIRGIVEGGATFFPPRPRWKRILAAALPEVSSNPSADKNYRRFAELLLARNPRPVVLVIGGSIPGIQTGCGHRRRRYYARYQK